MSVAPPGPGLGSNFNYFLTDGGNPITGVNVEITFAEPLISTSNGFGFQLNTYAQELPNAPSTTPNWQQYVVFMQPGDTTLYGIIDNWSGTLPSGVYAQVINDESQIASLPTATEIPAGATINIVPTFDSNNVITGITYIYTPPGGQAVSSSVTLTDLNVFGTNNKITSAYESPIVALTLNIVGDYNGNSGTFSSGSGTIVYSASQPLTVVTNEPSYTSFGGITGETANTVYGQLPVSNSNSITQSWGIGQSGSPDVEPAVPTLKLPIPPSAKKIQQDQ
ncbi:hypothetical protein HDV63DRAFT_365911 [Trichoderma sp. SZMC 28014]